MHFVELNKTAARMSLKTGRVADYFAWEYLLFDCVR
jgi:hypothetical protein